MRIMRIGAALGALVLLGAADAPPPLPGWMAGCWIEDRGESWFEECWTAPRGGMLIGSGRSGKGDKLKSANGNTLATARVLQLDLLFNSLPDSILHAVYMSQPPLC